MPLPFLIAAGAAVLGGAAAGGAAAVAAVAGATAAEIAGAAVAGGIVGEMLSDDKPETKPETKERAEVSEEHVSKYLSPEEMREIEGNKISTKDPQEYYDEAQLLQLLERAARGQRQSARSLL